MKNLFVLLLLFSTIFSFKVSAQNTELIEKKCKIIKTGEIVNVFVPSNYKDGNSIYIYCRSQGSMADWIFLEKQNYRQDGEVIIKESRGYSREIVKRKVLIKKAIILGTVVHELRY